MPPYEVEIQGDKVKVIVIDNAAVVDTKIDELRTSLKVSIVGVDSRLSYDEDTKKYDAGYVVLCGGNLCLIIQLCRMASFPASIVDFLADETICFVQVEPHKPSSLISGKKYNQLVPCMRRVVLAGDLTARVLTKPSIRSYGLQKLVVEDGLNLPSLYAKIFISWTDTVFTSMQIECATGEAYNCYKIGVKLLWMLDS